MMPAWRLQPGQVQEPRVSARRDALHDPRPSSAATGGRGRRLAGDRRHLRATNRWGQLQPAGARTADPRPSPSGWPTSTKPCWFSRESELGPAYRQQIEQVTPKILKAARWLAEPRYQERLERDDAHAPNRLLFDALAYGLSGLLGGDTPLKQVGCRFVDLAMAQYCPNNGVFLEKGAPTQATRPWPH